MYPVDLMKVSFTHLFLSDGSTGTELIYSRRHGCK